jgi:adenosylcobinamide-phosphate synthase
VALLLDAALSEPPARFHPVVWLGALIGRAERQAPRAPAAQFGYGAAVATVVPLVAACTAALVEARVLRLPRPLRLLALGAALKPAFALRGLLAASSGVEERLRQGDPARARVGLRALVSRDTAQLDESLIAAAAIESLAENLTDSVVAPLCAFALLGLPGAYAYRAINTLDSMIGYRGRYEWLGKAAARLDDVVNLLPARLSALLLTCIAPLAGGTSRGALAAVWRDRRRTASPNAGCTMAAAAGALGVRLEKPGHYVLLTDGRPPCAADIGRARRLVACAAGLGGLFAAGLALAAARTPVR